MDERFADARVRFDLLRERAFNLRWATVDPDVIPLTAADPDFPVALLHGSVRGRIGPLSGSLGVSASDSVRFRHPELGHAIEDVHTDHRFPPLPFFGP